VVFVADLGLNLAPKFIEEVDGGVGGLIFDTWVVKSGGRRVYFWVYSSARSGGRRTVVYGSWWRVGRGPVVSSLACDAWRSAL